MTNHSNTIPHFVLNVDYISLCTDSPIRRYPHQHIFVNVVYIYSSAHLNWTTLTTPDYPIFLQYLQDELPFHPLDLKSFKDFLRKIFLHHLSG